MNNKYFILSGIVSFSFYIFICFLVFFYISKPDIKKYTIKSKTTVIQLDMIIEKSDKKRIEKKEDKKIEKPIEKIIKKETSKSIEKKPDLKSLFGKVKTKEIKVVKKEINNITKTDSPKRYKAKFEKQKKSSNIKIDKIFNDKKTTTNIKNMNNIKSDNESDEYFSKVNELLNEWIPSTREEGLIAIIIVIINSNGEFNYRFDKYSGNTNFDLSLKAFLEEQKSIIYPKPKKGKKVNIKVDFKSKG